MSLCCNLRSYIYYLNILWLIHANSFTLTIKNLIEYLKYFTFTNLLSHYSFIKAN